MTDAAREAFAQATAVSRETLDKLDAYADLLEAWQARINLIAGSTSSHVWTRHFLDSAQLVDLFPKPSGTVIDLGSGAGFPGLVLAICGAKDVQLIEADRRKCVFLREVLRVTETSAVVHNRRVEDLAGEIEGDVIVARAFAPLPRLLENAAPLLRGSGILLLHKGRSVDDELTATRKFWHMSVDSFRSRSHDSGRILRIGDLSRVGNHDTERSAT